MKSNYPRTIENGSGESLTFVGREVVEGQERVLVRSEVAPGKGPPMHVHFQQSETLEVVEGRLGYQIQGEEEKFAGPGESVTFGPGVPHKFWAADNVPLRMTGYVSPPDNVEYFLGEVYRSAKDRDAGGRPDDYDSAFLLARYRAEYDMLEIPGLVKRAIFPVLRGIGRLTGKARRFQDAPPPLSK